MRAIPKWVERIHEQNEQPPIHAVCFHPEAAQLIVAAGDKVLVYDPSDGRLIESLKAHKDIVYCVNYAKDGKNHGDPIQCVAFNPISHQLASCSLSDFAIWSAEQKAVQKHKIGVRVNACAWTNDGQYIALGLANGVVSIRNKAGEEKSKIERPGGPNSPIYALAWNPPISGNANADLLCVADWGQTISFYSIGGQLVGKERQLGFDPLCATFFPDGEFLAVAGCNKSVQLFTREGVKLGTLGEQHDAWIWNVAIHPFGNAMVVACHDGSLAFYNLAFSTVHALYRERYAFRENMCDIIIQHLVSGQKVRIKCRDLVHKIAIYRNRLAVQLPERVVLYELNSAENQPMHYRVKEKIGKKFDCSLLVVTSQHLVLCQEKKLQSLDFTGILQREWIMDSFIRYIKVTGGPSGREGLLLGLKNGQVWRIFLDNPLPILVTTVLSSVRCLDLNSTRNKLAIVDDAGRLTVRDLLTDTLLYQDTGVNSVAWNTHLESMICYSHTSGGLSVRVGSLPPRSPQSMMGVVVGLCGATAFCLRGNVMSNVPLALGATMWQFVEAQMFDEAYQIACLGVPMSDWQGLAQAALDALNFQVARDAYVKIRSLPWLELIQELKEKQRRGDVPKEVLQGDILAFEGKFKEAARMYQKCGQSSKALGMYSDMRMFDLAQEYLKDGDSADKIELVRRRAEWACSVHEPRAAAELLLAAGESQRAVEIVAQQGWTDVLLDIGRRLTMSDRSSLELVASHLKRLKALPLAAEIYRKLGEEEQVVQLHIEAKDWNEAFRLTENLPQLRQTVHLKHAEFLAESDQFITAHEAFVLAGKPRQAAKLLKDLVECSVSEERFQDAAFYTWLHAKQSLQLADQDQLMENADAIVKQFKSLLKLSSIYYAYSTIHAYLREPFTSSPPLTLFNTSRFVANQIEGGIPPKGVSMFAVLYTLSKQAKVLGANKLHLQVNNKLQTLKAPPGIQEQVDINYMTSRASASGFNDPEELLPMCYKCSNYSPHLQGNRCPNCRQDFIFSYVSFEILPLAEFIPEQNITDQEAERLLMAPPKQFSEHHDTFADTMVNEDIGDLPTVVDKDMLRAIDPRSVLIVKWPPPLRTKYYRNLLPELQITVCPECRQAFHTEDFELQVLQKGHCPFCRTSGEILLN
uniref:Intraflagellar transport protein 122 homolog n=1 Tax=Culicoides sonorensis TaxID=179676 RepID=A0A336MIF6_CULSO